MKSVRPRPLPLAALGVALLAFAAPAGATVLFSDAFASPNGTLLSASTGWTRTFGTPVEPMTINNGALTLQSPSTGGPERVYHDLGQTYSTGSLYVGFDFTVNNVPATNINLAFFASDTSGVSGLNTGGYFNLGIGDSGGFKLGIASGASNSPNGTSSVQTVDSYTTGATYRVVIEYNFVAGALNNTANLYLNGSVVAAAVYAATPDEVAGFRYFGLRQPTTSNSAGVVIDDLVIANDFASAATFPSAVPEPASAAALFGASALALVAARRRRVV